MKKRTLAVLILAAAVVTGAALFGGRKPYRGLDPGEIASVTVRLSPPDATVQVPNIEEFAALLREVVVYRKDNSYKEYSGQGVIFTLTMKDGTQTHVMEYNPFLVIDGVGYRTRYGPCEALSQYANSLLE